MSDDPAEFQRREEQFQRTLGRVGWTLPLFTFIGLFSLGLLFYLMSQNPDVNALFPSDFLMGLATGFLSTAVIFYFYEVVFTRRMEKRSHFARMSGTRRRAAVLVGRQQALSTRQNELIGRVNTLAPGGLQVFAPKTRPQAAAMIDLINQLVGTLLDWDAIDEELTSALRDNVRILAEEGSQPEMDAALTQLLAFDVQRQQRAILRADLWAAIQRLTAALPGLPEDDTAAQGAAQTGG